MSLAEVVLSCGRLFLKVCGVYTAMQGDPCRDPEYHDDRWTQESLVAAAKKINKAEGSRREEEMD